MKTEIEYWRTKKNKDGSLQWIMFPPFDLADAQKKMEPEGRAHRFVTSGMTSQDESELTTDEQEMLSVVNDHVEQLNGFFERHAGDVKDTVEKLAVETDPDENLLKIERDFRKKTNTIFNDFRINLKKNYKDRIGAYYQLNSFKVKNKLTRSAKYPESKFYHLSIAFAAIVIEALANSYFFGQASDIGLLGGWITALCISIANVSFSMIIAGILFLRQTAHVNIYRKFVGYIGFGICLLLLTFLHIATAHYRELLTRNPDIEIISMEVLRRVWENPFGLKDLESLLLIGIGVVISVIGIWKGYTYDDPYPGYGEVYRDWEKADDEELELQKEFNREIGLAVNNAIDQTYNISKTIKDGKKHLEAIKGNVDSFFNCSESYYKQAHNGAVKLLTTFRNTLQQIYADTSRFPYDAKLLTQPNGLHTLNNVDGYRKEAQEIATIYMRGRGVYPNTSSLTFQVDLPFLYASN